MRPIRRASVVGVGFALTACALFAGRAAVSHPARPAHSPRAAVAVHGGKASQSGRPVTRPIVVREVAHGSVSAARLRAGSRVRPVHRRGEHEQMSPLPARSVRVRDGAFQGGELSRQSPSVLRSFNGLTNADNSSVSGVTSVPPDTVGDVGPTRYVEMTNTVWAVYDKTGVRRAGPFDN